MRWRERAAKRVFRAGAWLDVRDRRVETPDADLLVKFRLLRLAAADHDDRVRAVYQEVLDLDWVTARNVLTLLLLEIGRLPRTLSGPDDVRALADHSEFLLMWRALLRDEG